MYNRKILLCIYTHTELDIAIYVSYRLVANVVAIICTYLYSILHGMVIEVKNDTYLCIQITKLDCTVLEGLFGEYHSSSAALGLKCPEVIKQPLVH